VYALLPARMYCARGEFDEARRHLDWIAAKCDPSAMAPVTRTLLRLCAHLIADNGYQPEFWDALVTEACDVALLGEDIEVLCFATSAASRGGQNVEALRFFELAKQRVRGFTFWDGWLAALWRRIEETG